MHPEKDLYRSTRPNKRQRYLDRLSREQRRMPLHSRPILTLAQAHEINKNWATLQHTLRTSREKLENIFQP